MDILNWLYIKTADLIRTKANDPKTDLVALGAEVPFTTRGDGYQTYGMTLADAVHSGCTENNTLRTGIFDNYPFPIGYPVLLKTCTQVIDTPAFPTFLAVNLQGWKVAGSIELNENTNAGVKYLGTVENATLFSNFPWQIRGTAYCYDGLNNIYTALGNGATLYDMNSNVTVPVNLQFVPDYFPGGFDLYLVYSQADPTAEISGIISFEYEFLEDSTGELTFNYY